MASLLSANPLAAEIFNQGVAAAAYDLDRIALWQSPAMLRIINSTRPASVPPGFTDESVAWITRTESRLFPNSPLLGNGVHLFLESFERAEALGHYTRIFFILDSKGRLLKVGTHMTHMPGKGFSLTLCPVDDPSMPSFTRYDIATGRFSTNYVDNFYTFEDLALYELVVGGLSAKAAAEQMDIPRQRARYRIDQMVALIGADSISEMRQHYMDATTDFTLPTRKTVVHGECEHLVPILPADAK